MKGEEKKRIGGSPGTDVLTVPGRVRRLLITILLAIIVLIFLAAVGFLLLQISGKNSLYSKADDKKIVSTLAGMAVNMGGSTQNDGESDWQEGDIRYKGVHYRYNQDILTFLFLGIDKMSEIGAVKDGYDGGQSDAIFLLVLDPHQKNATVIGIPRDTMTEIEVYDGAGVYVGTTTAQITLQHGYGDGAQLSCERSVQAVSRLFYGLPVHGYCAINMGAIPLLNDAVGGIDLQCLETLDFSDFHAKEGEQLHLKGMDAYYYLHNRDTDSFNSAGRRLQRQKQYLTAYASAVLETIKTDLTFPVTLYNTLSKYMVTDISIDELGYMVPQMAGYTFSGEDMHILQGETVEGEKFEEFHVNETALYELILNVFYEKVA